MHADAIRSADVRMSKGLVHGSFAAMGEMEFPRTCLLDVTVGAVGASVSALNAINEAAQR